MKTKKPIVQMSGRTIRTVDSLLRGLIGLDIALQFMMNFHIIPVDSSKYVVQRSVVVFLLLGFSLGKQAEMAKGTRRDISLADSVDLVFHLLRAGDEFLVFIIDRCTEV